MATTSQERIGFSYRRVCEVLQDHLGGKFKRLLVAYRYQRLRDKNAIEIILEGVTKMSLNRALPAPLLKIFSRPYQRVTDLTVSNTLKDGVFVEQILTRGKFIDKAFFVHSTDESLWQNYRNRFPDKCQSVVEDADRIVRHEFDLLGSGPQSWGASIDWHFDPKSGYRWPKKFYRDLFPVSSLANDADVKLPYELSRMQHLPTLGKAYRLTGKETYAQELVAQVTHWLDDNPYLVGVNWTCAMDVAIRIVNIIWGLAFVEGSPTVTRNFKNRVLIAIWQHGQYLMRHLEYSIRPDGRVSNSNHYLSNIVGLVYLALLFPEFKAAENWRRIGIEGLSEEMTRQTHADGVDYESSISYHRLVLELFSSAALLCRLNEVQLSEAFWKRLEDMYSFTLHVTRPDGKVPQVGDADDGRLHILSDYGWWDRTDHRYLLSIGAALFNRPDMKQAARTFSEEAFWLLGRNGASSFDALGSSGRAIGSKAFPEAGFYVMRSGRNYLLACCNPVGTAGIGNHKHNDILSFELYAGDRPFIVDPGTYLYTSSQKWRNLFRSTRFHNTVMIDGEEQNRFKENSVFSLIADAEPIIHRWHSTGESDFLEVEHTGYRRLSQGVSHRRVFAFDKRANILEITDTLRGAGQHTAEWYFHYDHGVDIERINDSLVLAHSNGVTLQMAVASTVPLNTTVQEAWVSRSYGTKLPGKILILQGVFSDRCGVAFKNYLS
jgi:hypothetical protein